MFTLILSGIFVYSCAIILAIPRTFSALLPALKPLEDFILTLPFAEPPAVTPYAPFGILITAYIFFVVAATGFCIIGSWSCVFGVKKYEVITRRALWLSLLMLIVSLIIIAVEVGRTERAYFFYVGFANLRSNMFLMILGYTLYLIFIIFEFWLSIRRDVAILARHSIGWRRVFYLILTLGIVDTSDESYAKDMKLVKYVGVASLLAVASTHANMGSIFGTMRTFPLPLSDNVFIQLIFMPASFIIAAILAVALIPMAVIITYWATRRKLSREVLDVLMELRWIIVFLIVADLVCVLVWESIRHYTVPLPAYELFWTDMVVGHIVPLVLLATPGRGIILRMVLVGIFVPVGIFLGKLDMAVGRPVVLVPAIPYFPALIEAMMIIGAIGLVMLLHTIGERLLPLEELEPKQQNVSDSFKKRDELTKKRGIIG